MTIDNQIIGLPLLFIGLVFTCLSLASFLFDYYKSHRTPVPKLLAQKRELVSQKNIVYSVFLPVVELLAAFSKRFITSNWKKKVQKDLDLSGNPLSLTADEFFGFKILVVILVVILFSYLQFSLISSFNLVVSLIVGSLGWFYPSIWLKDKCNIRTVKVNTRLPYVLDFLILAMEAGMDFISALRQVIARSPVDADPLLEEISRCLNEIDLGKPRKEAILGIKERIESKGVDSLVTAIIYAEEQGIPLKNVMKQSADSLRLNRFQAAEKMILEAPVKLLLPLMFIFISVLLTLFGGIIVNFVSGKMFI